MNPETISGHDFPRGAHISMINMIGGVGSGPWEVLTAEMRRYEYDIGPTGQISYAAPSGYHDDCVMALALAAWGCHTYGVEPGRMLRLGDSQRSTV